MQTFLPYPDFAKSAQVLDRQRLGKQRVEAWQLLQSQFHGGGWVHHPASRMWRGHALALAQYGLVVCLEWQKRGYIDRMGSQFAKFLADNAGHEIWSPSWMGDPLFHRSHQSNLIRKWPEHYSPLFPGVPGHLPYKWPLPT